MKFQLFLVGVLAVAAFAAPVAEYVYDEDCLEEDIQPLEIDSNIQEPAMPAHEEQPLIQFAFDEEEAADCEDGAVPTPAPVEVDDEDCEEEFEDTYEEVEDVAAGFMDDASVMMGGSDVGDFMDEDCEEIEAEPAYNDDDVRGDFGYAIEPSFEEAAAVIDVIADEVVEPDQEECEEY